MVETKDNIEPVSAENGMQVAEGFWAVVSRWVIFESYYRIV